MRSHNTVAVAGRRLHLTRMQALGIPLLVALPVVGLSGIFRSDVESVQASLAGTSLQVSYPARMEAGARSTLRATITNDAPKEAELKIKVAKNVLDRFSSVRFKPQPAGTDENYFVFYFPHVQPGTSRTVEVEVRANGSGMQDTVFVGMFDGLEGPRAKADVLIAK